MITNPDSQYEGLVPDRVQSLLLYVCLVNFVTRYSILYNIFRGFGSGAACPILFLIL